MSNRRASCNTGSKRPFIAIAAALLLFAGFVVRVRAQAQSAPVKWTAMSNTAMAITGDIVMSPTDLTIGGKDYPLRLVETIGAAQLGAAGQIAALTQPKAASLYAVQIPGTAKFLNNNTLCGPTPVTWLLTVTGTDPSSPGGILVLAPLSGATQPAINAALGNSTAVCATLGYSR